MMDWGKYTLEAYNWRYAIAFAFAIVVWLAFELYGAFGRTKPGDTFTELVRPFLWAHPFLWWTTLGLYVGFVVWLGFHLWGGWR